MQETPLVDAHARVFRQDFPLVDNPVRRPDYDFARDAYEKVLDGHGIRFAALSAGSLWGDCTDRHGSGQGALADGRSGPANLGKRLPLCRL